MANLISTILIIAAVYLLIGLAMAIWLAFKGVNTLDASARGGGIGFRILIIPGLTVFWPLFLLRLKRGLQTPPVEHNAHRVGGKS